MPLVTYAHTQAEYNGAPVWKLMERAVDSGRMPLFGGLSAEEKKTLDDWFAKQAPGSTKECPGGSVPGAGADNRGMVTLGDEKIDIPAAARDFAITKTCSTLSKNGEPVLIVSAIPHMHYLGKSIATEHFRNGESLGFISNNSTADAFTWTDYKSTPYGREYLPGDKLVTTCRYDNPAAYSQGFPAEMCYNFLLVSPISEANAACSDQ